MHYVNQLVLNGQINNIGEFIRTNSGKSFRRGMEFNALAKLFKTLELTGNLNLSQNENQSFKMEISSGIQDYGNTKTSFSPNIIANLGVRFNPTESFSFGLSNQYVGKQFLDNSESLELQLKDYFLTDFNVEYRFKVQRNDVALKLLVNNLFNKKYVNNGYVYDGSPYYFSQAGINFMFGLSWKIQ